MNRSLRVAMIALVLVNLAFVYATESASWTWLAPLVLLAVASPWLVRLADRLLARMIWSGAILGVFALLVHHVTYAGPQFLLEDGLLLAGLCQVHLLNNITDRQKPDLLFFNSFLIVLVTSFLSFDVRFCIMFVLYVPVLVVAMQLLTFSRSGRPVTGRILRLCFNQGLRRSAVLVLLSFAVFFFLPRDFRRHGFFRALRLDQGGVLSRVGFSDGIELGHARPTVTDNRVVMRVRRIVGDRTAVPAYWRGATLDHFDGTTWRPARRPVVLHPWRMAASGDWRRGPGPARARVEVELVAPHTTRLFLPLSASRIRVAPSADRWTYLTPMRDLTLTFARRVNDRGVHGYGVDIGGVDDGSSRPGRIRPARLQVHLSLPRRTASRVGILTREILDGVEARSMRELVAAIGDYLSSSFRYLRPGAPGAARSLEAFLDGEGGGHCEYFATAYAAMLRAVQIPCRVVTGFRSEEWDEPGRVLTIRARHAHAWVEVLDPNHGWYTVDATPAIDEYGTERGTGLLARIRARVRDFWNQVTGFNESGRNRVLAWAVELPGRTWDSLTADPGTALLVLALAGLLACLVYLRRRRRNPRVPPVVRRYLGTVRRSGLTMGSGETPRELLARARASRLPAARLADLERATVTHERERFAGRARPPSPHRESSEIHGFFIGG
jgi:transglutaminase-like putative cysteine protease